jgi:Tol biopolymer transport system component
VWAAGFDTQRLAVRGEPVVVLESVRLGFGGFLFAVASDGTAIHVAGPETPEAALVWIDRTGKISPALTAKGGFQSPRLSPDGSRVVVSVQDGSAVDLWRYEFERGTRLRLTTSGRNRRTVWSPDGKTIAFYATAGSGDQDLFVVPAAGGEPPTRLLERPRSQFPSSWSPDGRFLVFEEWEAASNRRDVLLLPRGEAPRPLVVTGAYERGAVVSPDGQSVAFVSDESGRAEVYVQPFADPGPKLPVSSNGALQPVWSRDGRELFYREGDWLMAAAVARNPFRIVRVSRLFEMPGDIYTLDPNFADYDVAPDGRFIAVRNERVPISEIQVVLNWSDELRRRLAR